MAFSKIFFFALSLNGTQLCLLKRGLELIFLRSIPHFVHWWWGVFPKKFSCSMLVPTTTQGMSIELSLNLCLSIQFRALEFASGSAEPSFWIHFWGNQSLISLLLRSLGSLCCDAIPVFQQEAYLALTFLASRTQRGLSNLFLTKITNFPLLLGVTFPYQVPADHFLPPRPWHLHGVAHVTATVATVRRACLTIGTVQPWALLAL